jgi:hypothetical protein
MRRLTSALTVRVTPAQEEYAESVADAEGWSKSEVIRRALDRARDGGAFNVSEAPEAPEPDEPTGDDPPTSDPEPAQSTANEPTDESNPPGVDMGKSGDVPLAPDPSDLDDQAGGEGDGKRARPDDEGGDVAGDRSGGREVGEEEGADRNGGAGLFSWLE